MGTGQPRRFPRLQRVMDFHQITIYSTNCLLLPMNTQRTTREVAVKATNTSSSRRSSCGAHRQRDDRADRSVVSPTRRGVLGAVGLIAAAGTAGCTSLLTDDSDRHADLADLDVDPTVGWNDLHEGVALR